MTIDKKIPRKYHPRGMTVIYEDRDIIVGDKRAGHLTVAAKWNRENTIHADLNRYVRKGNSRSRARVYPVHRLDQETTGVLIFAKTPQAQHALKDNWETTEKIYYAIVHGHPAQKEATISSYLSEDEDYVVHSNRRREHPEDKLARTRYTLIKQARGMSLLRIDLLTGRKNQIRVHLAGEGHPVVGDAKYGRPDKRHRRLALHAHSIRFAHPFSGKRVHFEVPVPDYFETLLKN